MLQLSVIMILTLLPFPLRIALEYWPGFALCFIFCSVLFLAAYLWRNFWLYPGALCNAAAALANGGMMPVFSVEVNSPGFHVQGTPDAALWLLCDILPGGASIGDILLMVGFGCFIASRFHLLRAHTVIDPQTKTKTGGLILEDCHCGAVRQIEFGPGNDPIIRVVLPPIPNT